MPENITRAPLIDLRSDTVTRPSLSNAGRNDCRRPRRRRMGRRSHRASLGGPDPIHVWYSCRPRSKSRDLRRTHRRCHQRSRTLLRNLAHLRCAIARCTNFPTKTTRRRRMPWPLQRRHDRLWTTLGSHPDPARTASATRPYIAACRDRPAHGPLHPTVDIVSATA